MKTYKALGALLLYPSTELIAALPEIEAVLDEEGLLGPEERAGVGALLGWLSAGDVYDLQEAYTALFDRARSLSLHLYEHVHGEARERGQAMVRLQTVYELHGFSHVNHELPDYLPLFCEFLSEIPERAARSLLGDAVTILEAVRGRLAKRESPYAAPFAALVSLASRKVDPALLEAISKGLDGDEDFDAIDAAWAEEPVTFGPLGSPCARASAGQPLTAE
jgi:nitrate reductase delta subunit